MARVFELLYNWALYDVDLVIKPFSFEYTLHEQSD
jgi:hypothetical protein